MTACWDKMAKVWDAEAPPRPEGVRSAAVDADGRAVVGELGSGEYELALAVETA